MTKRNTATAVQVAKKTEYDSELGALPTISARIRFLVGKGLTYYKVSKIMTAYEGRFVRPQWVRNVAVTPVKGQ